MKRLTVLITNQSLWFRSGTETYVRDLAIGLLKCGHSPVVFSPHLGEIAKEIRRAAIPVVDDLKDIAIEPDVIHGHHSLDVMSAVLRFPNTPAVFVCHDSFHWHDTPPLFPQIRRYMAVDEATQDRLTLRHAVPPEKVRIVHNAVDLIRFRPQRELPSKPQRALVFSNYMQPHQLSELRRACDARHIALDAVGERQGNKTSTPESLLPGYDLVFAKGRSALEALACGTSVIVCDAWGCGPLVTAGEFETLRRVNFGLRVLRQPLHADFLGPQIDRYNAPDATEVTAIVRRECGVDSLIEQVLEVYANAIAEQQVVPVEDTLAAAYEGVTWWTHNWSRLLQEAHAKHAEELHELAASTALTPPRLKFVPRMLRSIRKRRRVLAESVLKFVRSGTISDGGAPGEDRKAA